jgi:hypothetical protein
MTRSAPFSRLSVDKRSYSYEHSHLQNRKDHKRQHRFDDFGRKNKERLPD